MEKRKVPFKIDYELNWAYGVEISQLKKDKEKRRDLELLELIKKKYNIK